MIHLMIHDPYFICIYLEGSTIDETETVKNFSA
jgi:hypothetical protein